MTEDHKPQNTPDEPENLDRDVQPSSLPVQLEEMESLKKQAADYLAGWQRAKADYLNLKRDSEKEKNQLLQVASAALVLEILPIYDHLKLAIKHIPREQQDTEWTKGIKHIASEFQQFVEKLGFQEIKTVGEAFNPDMHHAVSKERREGMKPGIVIEELSTGFMVQGKPIEPAKVRVSM